MKQLVRTFAGALLAGSLTVTAGAWMSPAAAWDNDPPPPAGGGGGDGAGDGGEELPDSSTGDSSDSGGYATGQVRDCSIVSSPSYLGMSCGSSTGGDKKSIKEILDGDPLPDCWHDALSESELVAMSLQNDEDSTWYWERCLKGIDPKTLKILPEGISFTIGLVALENGEPTFLTQAQQALVEFSGVDQQIPAPIAAVSPSAYPRVGQWVSFFDGSDDQLTVQASGVTLRATVASLDVEPLGDGRGDQVSCTGTGYKAKRGDTPETHPGCWYKYAASSAAEEDQKYPVEMTAHWVVDVSQDGGATWTVFNSFEKSQVTTVPVTEIQALVVR